MIIQCRFLEVGEISLAMEGTKLLPWASVRPAAHGEAEAWRLPTVGRGRSVTGVRRRGCSTSTGDVGRRRRG